MYGYPWATAPPVPAIQYPYGVAGMPWQGMAGPQGIPMGAYPVGQVPGANPYGQPGAGVQQAPPGAGLGVTAPVSGTPVPISVEQAVPPPPGYAPTVP